MIKRRPAALCIIPLCLMMASCAPFNRASDSYTQRDASGSEQLIEDGASGSGVTSQEDIILILLNAMYANQAQCTFLVPDKSYIDTDYWLNRLPGINRIHCEYLTLGGACRVTATLSYWDNYPIVSAFRTGNTSALNERQLRMYDRYCDILKAQTSQSRSALDNELAIHDYIVSNVEYVLDRDAEYPAYDALFKGSSSCGGYAEMFQTLMDMLGIQCIPITGRADGDNHIWNMVCIDNEWYHVDTTWDDPVNGDGYVHHNYFNITDEDILLDHTPDSEHPSAVSTRLAYYNVLNYPIFSTQEELNIYMESVIRSRSVSCRFQVRSFSPDIQLAIQQGRAELSYRASYTCRNSYSTYLIIFKY